jgi:hypothetical protein
LVARIIEQNAKSVVAELAEEVNEKKPTHYYKNVFIHGKIKNESPRLNFIDY